MPLTAPQFADADAGAGPLSLELDGLGTRTRGGRTELKVIRDANTGTALGSFGRWSAVINRAWQLGTRQPAHLVSDGDAAIAARIELVYGRWASHHLCVFHLLRHLATGQVRQRTLVYYQSGRLEQHNRELRRRGMLGTVWTEHNRLAWQQIQGRLNQTT